MKRSDKDLFLRRGLAAYYEDKNEHEWPDHAKSGVERAKAEDPKHGTLVYVVLRDSKGTMLACYRVRQDTRLKKLRRLPEGVA
jgi:hypothetical protein